jgi:hypothetical protein
LATKSNKLNIYQFTIPAFFKKCFIRKLRPKLIHNIDPRSPISSLAGKFAAGNGWQSLGSIKVRRTEI